MVSLTQDEGFQPQILIDALNGHSQFFAPINGMVIVNVTDSLMVMDGASSGRIERGQQGVLGSTIAKIETHEATNSFVYHFLKQKQEDIKQNTTGTSIPHADKSKIQKYLIATPADNSILRQFETTTKILLSKSINNSNQIVALQEIRDMLLPKLMSGKIRVPIDNKMERQ
jgi:type I restriction enzyme S subunit